MWSSTSAPWTCVFNDGPVSLVTFAVWRVHSQNWRKHEHPGWRLDPGWKVWFRKDRQWEIVAWNWSVSYRDCTRERTKWTLEIRVSGNSAWLTWWDYIFWDLGEKRRGLWILDKRLKHRSWKYWQEEFTWNPRCKDSFKRQKGRLPLTETSNHAFRRLSTYHEHVHSQTHSPSFHLHDYRSSTNMINLAAYI